MKTLKISLVALVLAVGLGSAVAEKIQAAPKPLDQVYSWTSATKPPFTGTISQAETNYNCSDATNVVCATGTASGLPNKIIHKTM